MEYMGIWVAGLCVCAAAVGFAEKLLPEGSVRSAVYFVMGLVVMSCFLTPVGNIPKAEFSVSEQNVNTDWLSRTTQEMFASRVRDIVQKYLNNKKIKAKNIDVYTDIDEDGNIYIDKVRITVTKEYADKADEICSNLYLELGLDADVNVR